MIKNYFTIAWRNLLKNKVSGTINIVGLALGMAVTILIGLWIHDELTFSQYHKNYDRLAQLYLRQSFNGSQRASSAISQPSGRTVKEQFGEYFEDVSFCTWNFEHILAYDEKKIRREGVNVDPGFPKMLSLEMIEGTYEDALKEPNSIILSESVAEALFGNEDPMGKSIRYDAVSNLEITGIYKDLPLNSDFHDVTFMGTWEYYKSVSPWVQATEQIWGDHSFQLFVQLKDRVDLAVASAAIADIEKAHNPDTNPEHFLFPMSKWHLYSEFQEGVNVGGAIQNVWLFGIIGLFVLILACINFMNLSTARSEKRAREVGIRKTIGSGKGQLISQFLSESLLVALVSTALALGIVWISLPWFNQLADKSMYLPLNNIRFVLILIVFVGLTGLLAGSYPAFYLSSFRILRVLKGNFKASGRSAAPRQFLVTLQFTISVALIIGTIVVFQQLEHARERKVGYDREGLIQILTNNELNDKEGILRSELLKSGVVEEVSHTSGPITSVWSNTTGFSWEEKDPAVIMRFARMQASHEIGKVLGWNILEGRDFSREMATDTAALILNEAAVEYIGLDDMLGKKMRYRGIDHQVVGIVSDMIMESPWEPVRPTIYVCSESNVNMHLIRLRQGMPVSEAIAGVKAVFEKISPSSPFEYDFVDDSYGRKFAEEERVGKLAKVFAFLAILISCLGLFGLSAFVAEQKTKEIGIRKVLGATVASLWSLQSRSFAILILVACLIATPLSWYLLDSWLDNYQYRIEIKWYVFVLASLLALLVAMATVSFQSIRAAMSNPIRSLRSE